MKQHEVISDKRGIKLQRDGQAIVISIDGGSVTLTLAELEEFEDHLHVLHDRAARYAEAEALKKVIET